MATLLLSAIGTLVGGPIGGAIGALVGGQVDRMIIGGGSREGARLKELSVTTSSYGSPVPRIFGRMRVSGTIIWATDLVEHREKQGGGKGKPSLVSYTYSASLAVVLSSRPLTGVGRIWADGNLLRGAGGDMKTGGSFRFHSGTYDQAPDSLIAAAEGEGGCPAFRGLSYVVFEDLQLSDFGNRIPALTFEVFADEGELFLDQLVAGVIENVVAATPLPGLAGISCEGALSDMLGQLDPAYPIDCDVSGDQLVLSREASAPLVALPEAAVSTADDAFGAEQGYSRKRLPAPSARPEILRYYDLDRDYQPGLQRAPGRPGLGQPSGTELPAAMTASDARRLAEAIARRASWSRQTMAWRSAELDPAVRPGSLVTVPDQAGIWRVNEWEWRESGVELGLWRAFTAVTASTVTDPGRSNPPVDAPLGQTVLQAFELPGDGAGNGAGGGDTPLLYATMSSASAGWSGAALYVDQGDGQLQPLGPGMRGRAVTGHALEALLTASPHLFDRTSSPTVQLVADDFVLADATPRQLAFGANRALLGEEIIQFARAIPLGGGVWRLEGLLRGRAGTESAIANHAAGDPFVLLDGIATSLDAAMVGDLPSALITAIGLGDEVPVTSLIACRGITRRPLFPVHGRRKTGLDGSLTLSWTRRARGAWTWLDGVDSPLHEQSEAYEIALGSFEDPVASWATIVPELTLSAGLLTSLRATATGQPILVRQRGSYALSEPLFLTILS